MRVCYFVSEYPAVSHTFIRREIAELERNDIHVLRVSLRLNGRNLVDAADLSEKNRTRYILDGNIAKLVTAFVYALWRRPRALPCFRHVLFRHGSDSQPHNGQCVEGNQ